MSVDALLEALIGNSRRDREPIHAQAITNRLKDLRAWATGLPHEDHDEEVGYVHAAGDPMLMDAKGKLHHYWGPAVMVVFNRFGIITALEYIGVTGDRNYISEVWRHDPSTDKYKYRYVDDEPGTVRICNGKFDGPQFRVGDSSWASEAYPDEKPPETFLKQFKPASRTFFVNNSTGTFMQGPDFGALAALLKTPVKISKQIIGGMVEDPSMWMKKTMDMITQKSGYHYLDHSHYHQADCPVNHDAESTTKILKVQVAQFACGLIAATLKRDDAQRASTGDDDFQSEQVS